MGVTTHELLIFVQDVIDREGRTLADEGVILCDEIREEGIRLLHAAGWKTQEEEDAEALREDERDTD